MAQAFAKAFYKSTKWRKCRAAFVASRVNIDGGLCQICYYEAQVEPDLLQIAAEHTRKLWNRRQRAFGNKLYLESSNLQYASMSTKLSLESMVDRGAMLPNEWRAVFGLAPVAGGDEPIRRLDTAPVKQTKSGGETE